VPGRRFFGGHGSGWYLLNSLTNDQLVLPQKPKYSLLPLLTVLFLVSYGLLTMLVVEQGKTIDTQRYLIKQLFSDSVQLTTMKGSAIQKRQAAQAKANSQAQDKANRNHSAGKLQRPLPQKPPKDAADTTDERRSLISI